MSFHLDDTQGGAPGKTEPVIGRIQAEECQASPAAVEARKEAWSGLVESLEVTNPANTLISDFWTPELGEEELLWC